MGSGNLRWMRKTSKHDFVPIELQKLVSWIAAELSVGAKN
jgi:hypothetical protein